MSKKLNNNSVALAGEFAVLSQLMLKGYNANLTLGHTKGVDILISDPDTGKMFKMEVKTNYRSSRSAGGNSKLFGKFASGWTMNKKHETIIDSNLYYCFVNISQTDFNLKFFILPSKVVAGYVREQHKLWLNAKSNHNDTPMRVFRLGFKKEKYSIKTPCVEEFENKWDFK